MKLQELIGGARLWNHDTAAEHALRWTQSEGMDFLHLKSSQLRGLERAVAGARTRFCFLHKMRIFLEALAKRGKGETVWESKTDGKTLFYRFRREFHVALRAAKDSQDPENKSFQICCERLSRANGQAGLRPVRRSRELAILREFLAVLIKCHRAEAKDLESWGQNER